MTMVRDAYVAMADPVRRDIMDLLKHEATLPAGVIASHISGISRPAVSKHLRILRECGVVTAQKEGKQQQYRLNEQPLRDVREGWLKRVTDGHTQSLVALRALIENGPEGSN